MQANKLCYVNKAILLLSLLCIGISANGQQHQSSLLWKISHPESKSESYIFGTIHLIDAQFFYMPDTLKEIIESVDVVCFELDIGNPMEMMMDLIVLGDKLFLPDTVTIDSYLSENERKLLDNKLADSDFPSTMIKKLKPFFISTLLTENGGEESSSFSYELEINKLASDHGKEICGLEGLEEQLSLFDSIPIEDQVSDLVSQLKSETVDYSDSENKMDSLIILYVNQDLEGLDRLIREQLRSSENTVMSTKNVLTDRNKNWLEKIVVDLEGDSEKLYAVGAGHLGGEEGLIELLLDLNYEVKPIYFNWKEYGNN